MTESRALADFLAGLFESVDEPERQRLTALATDYLVDTLGCMVYGSRQPWSQAVINHALVTGAEGPCTVIGAGDANSTTPAMASLANGASAHAFELDDVHEEAISHPGAVVIPAALAVGNQWMLR